MNIVILAAGLGKRMRSALPKVLHPIAGRPMLSQVLDTARAVAAAAGQAARIIVVVGHGAEQIRTRFADQRDLRYALQEPQLGTGHAVQQAAAQLDESAPTLVLYGDVPLVRDTTLQRLAAAAGEGVAILTVRLADPRGYGRILRDAAGAVTGIVEDKDATAQQRAIEEVNTGILIAPTVPLKRWLAGLRNDNAQKEFYLTDIVGAAVAQGVPVTGIPAGEVTETLGVNSKAQLAQLERIAQSRAAERLLDDGVTLADPARIDIRGRLAAGADVSIDVGCVFEGEVVLGDGVSVGPYCVLKDVRIGTGTQIGAYCHFDGATIGTEARLGPYARLRPGADIGNGAHIGNFVEIKASRVDEGAKANHLAYIGDAHIGARTNIGAGTIIANYDGVNKHRTDVGADVLVGSNAVLVAPIKVGAGSTIGAGSTVGREVPAGKLTIARGRQVTLDDWVRPIRKK